GLPTRLLPRIGGWRDRPPADVLRSLGPSARLRGLVLRSPRFALPLTLRGQPVTLTLNILRPSGEFAAVNLGTANAGTHVLRASVPAGRIVALRLSFPVIAAFLAGHRESG